MKYFDIEDNKLIRVRDWPKRLTKKRAFQLSIRKWEFLVEAGDTNIFDGASYTCALCQLYDLCDSCPISDYANETDCFNTPYRDDDPKAELVFLKELYLDKYGEEYP